MEQEEPLSEECDIVPSLDCSVNAVRSEYDDQTPNPSIPESNSETVLDGGAVTTYTPRKELSIKVAIISLVLIFLVFSGSLALVYNSFPAMDRNETIALKFPTSLEDAKLLGKGNIRQSKLACHS